MTTTEVFQTQVADHEKTFDRLKFAIKLILKYKKDPAIAYQELEEEFSGIRYLINDKFDGNMDKMLAKISKDIGQSFYFEGKLIAPQNQYSNPLFELTQSLLRGGHEELRKVFSERWDPKYDLAVHLWSYRDYDDEENAWDFWNRFLFSSSDVWTGENILAVMVQLQNLYRGRWPSTEEFNRNQPNGSKFELVDGRERSNAFGLYQKMKNLERGGQHYKPVPEFFKKLYGTIPC